MNQFQYCEENGIPFCAVIGEEELKNEVVTLRNMVTREQVTFQCIGVYTLFYKNKEARMVKNKNNTKHSNHEEISLKETLGHKHLECAV